MKRTVPLLLTFVVGVFMLAEAFIPSWRYRVLFTFVQEWGIVLVAGAYIMGLINLLQLNVPIIRRRGPDWPYKVVLLLGDWTNRNPEITKALERHGRIGVPLYLAYPAGRREAVVLPQVLSAEEVKAAFR